MAVVPFNVLIPTFLNEFSILDSNSSFKISPWSSFGYSHFPAISQSLSREMNEMKKSMDDMWSSLETLNPKSSKPAVSRLNSGPNMLCDANGRKHMKMQFDVREFKPDEIRVTFTKGMIHVEGKHEENTESSRCYFEYSRKFNVPEYVESDKVTSKLSPEGILSIDVELERGDRERKDSGVIAAGN